MKLQVLGTGCAKRNALTEAATAYLARRVDRRGREVAGTITYTLGRIAAYTAITGLLALGLASAPGLSHGLQRWMTPLLGPF